LPEKAAEEIPDSFQLLNSLRGDIETGYGRSGISEGSVKESVKDNHPGANVQSDVRALLLLNYVMYFLIERYYSGF
jgi:hypothetical protein